MGSTPAAFIVQPPLLCSLTYDHDLITARGKSPFQCLPLLLQALNSFVLLQSVSQSRRIPKGWNLNFGGWNIGPRCQVFSNLDQAEHEPNHPNPKDELLYYLLLSLLFKPWLAVFHAHARPTRRPHFQVEVIFPRPSPAGPIPLAPVVYIRQVQCSMPVIVTLTPFSWPQLFATI